MEEPQPESTEELGPLNPQSEETARTLSATPLIYSRRSSCADGASYIVARENTGESASLVAAAALMLDYVLTVSVSISSGTDAITSAFIITLPPSSTSRLVSPLP